MLIIFLHWGKSPCDQSNELRCYESLLKRKTLQSQLLCQKIFRIDSSTSWSVRCNSLICFVFFWFRCFLLNLGSFTGGNCLVQTCLRIFIRCDWTISAVHGLPLIERSHSNCLRRTRTCRYSNAIPNTDLLLLKLRKNTLSVPKAWCFPLEYWTYKEGVIIMTGHVVSSVWWENIFAALGNVEVFSAFYLTFKNRLECNEEWSWRSTKRWLWL